jgi:hypothetical protein
MWERMTSFRMRAAALVLESVAAHAGSALACRYASSDEFEAALISERRAAGVYGPKRRRRHVLLAGAAGSMLAVVLWMI